MRPIPIDHINADAKQDDQGVIRLDSIRFSLRPVRPFNLMLTAWALRRRPINMVDRWEGSTYKRILVIEERAVEVCLRQRGSADAPRIEGTMTGANISADMKRRAVRMLERMLGLRADLSDFYRAANRDPRLARLVSTFRGVKPPRFPTLFEALANGIACQQLSLALGITLLNRLSAAYGIAIPTRASSAHAFPRAADLAGVNPASLRALGFSTQKARALIELARVCLERRINERILDTLDDEPAISRLETLRGVGRWTAEYALLRGLGRLHVFPGDDVGARKKLQQWLHVRKSLDYAGVRRVLARWEPYAGLIYFHLLLKGLHEEGHLP